MLNDEMLSDEILASLQNYVDLLIKWQKTINLIGAKTQDDIWHRHVYDSSQLWPLANPKASAWLDIGSGGGFPGIVIAIIAKHQNPHLRVTLVDSDKRKAAFLGHVTRVLGLDNTNILAKRIESLENIMADVVSARALAHVNKILELAHPFLKKGSEILLLKGENLQAELNDLSNDWQFDYKIYKSKTQKGASVLKITDLIIKGKR